MELSREAGRHQLNQTLDPAWPTRIEPPRPRARAPRGNPRPRRSDGGLDDLRVSKRRRAGRGALGKEIWGGAGGNPEDSSRSGNGEGIVEFGFGDSGEEGGGGRE